MEALKDLVHLMRICRSSQSILIWYNVSSSHATSWAVQQWSISRAIGSDYFFCLQWALRFVVSAKLFCICRNTFINVASPASPVQIQLHNSGHHLFATASHCSSSLSVSLSPTHRCEQGHCRRLIPDNVVKSYIFSTRAANSIWSLTFQWL